MTPWRLPLVVVKTGEEGKAGVQSFYWKSTSWIYIFTFPTIHTNPPALWYNPYYLLRPGTVLTKTPNNSTAHSGHNNNNAANILWWRRKRISLKKHSLPQNSPVLSHDIKRHKTKAGWSSDNRSLKQRGIFQCSFSAVNGGAVRREWKEGLVLIT